MTLGKRIFNFLKPAALHAATAQNDPFAFVADNQILFPEEDDNEYIQFVILEIRRIRWLLIKAVNQARNVQWQLHQPALGNLHNDKRKNTSWAKICVKKQVAPLIVLATIYLRDRSLVLINQQPGLNITGIDKIRLLPLRDNCVQPQVVFSYENFVLLVVNKWNLIPGAPQILVQLDNGQFVVPVHDENNPVIRTKLMYQLFGLPTFFSCAKVEIMPNGSSIPRFHNRTTYQGLSNVSVISDGDTAKFCFFVNNVYADAEVQARIAQHEHLGKRRVPSEAESRKDFRRGVAVPPIDSHVWDGGGGFISSIAQNRPQLPWEDFGNLEISGLDLGQIRPGTQVLRDRNVIVEELRDQVELQGLQLEDEDAKVEIRRALKSSVREIGWRYWVCFIVLKSFHY